MNKSDSVISDDEISFKVENLRGKPFFEFTPSLAYLRITDYSPNRLVLFEISTLYLTSKGGWAIAQSPILQTTITVERLQKKFIVMLGA